jgi:Fic family protein
MALDSYPHDADYKPFPTFAEWIALAVDTAKWERYANRLEELRSSATSDLFKTAQEHVKRAAAIQTGVIEGLYDDDRGFTITAAKEVAVWQAALNARAARTKSLIESQLQAYDLVLDFATKSAPMSEAHIREVHKVICGSQATYKVQTDHGPQEHQLPIGEYKRTPNHVIGADSKPHSYAPVDKTPSEMHRLCNELRSEAFEKAHPVLQAAYAHYALVAVHPFADGNGRVARALTSIYTYRSNSVPLLITDDQRQAYFDALAAADAGNYQPLVNFIFARGIDSMQLVTESLRAASRPSLEQSATAIGRLYTTKGGYRHEEVDDAGYKLFDLFVKTVREAVNNLPNDSRTTAEVQVQTSSISPSNPEYRFPVKDGRKELRITLTTAKPASANITYIFALEVPRDGAQEDELVIRCQHADDHIEARIAEVMAPNGLALEMRLTIAVERILSGMLRVLSESAAAKLRDSGYP